MLATLGTWDEGIRTFLQEAAQKGPQPLDMDYEERRRMTHEPRVRRQLELEDQWKGTFMEGIWKGMRRFARPVDDYKVSENRFYEYLVSVGISSEFLGNKLYKVFQSEACPEVDFLRVCKAIHLGLTEIGTSFKFLEHCYKSLAQGPVSEELDCATVMRACELQRRMNAQKTASTALELKLQQLEGVLQYFEETGETSVDIGVFRFMFFEERWRYWAGTFIKPLLEAAAKYFSFPYGVFPTIPLRWTKTTEPLSYDSHEVYDADSLLLRNVELTGGDNTIKKKKSRKGLSTSSSRKK
ncbi:hypothetical protein TraAM80_09372 [Trypanosoma rangeli]|uniref:Uncharacterized protein n=1 Tax=Trypanosoma rangeli TaxID=5698 RepID=A0A3R7JV72_TRYRA|nr:uncharacterized protein TraAM80_09372 [Trypanosoma rangeli]RNE97340.1 hypothetical protein TraAM80_09372 [Trypanosoma rangeli]|eukprot:RNE97340.1 hypothetical protein TraAM80_09372 [Trypanosoma rangeli]